MGDIEPKFAAVGRRELRFPIWALRKFNCLGNHAQVVA